MIKVPETLYVQVGDADVAYQVFGAGPVDLLYFYGLGSHIDFLWDEWYADFVSRLMSFSRVIIFDRRGTGASDAVSGSAIPTWENWTEDIEAVLDAAGSQQAAIFASLDAGPIAILFAALHPERVRALVLANTSARYLVAADYPIGKPPELARAVVEFTGRTWGSPELARMVAPGLDAEFVDFLARQFRAAATPRSAAAQYRYLLESLDVRQALPLIQVPTLVLHNRQNPLFPIEHGRYLAEHIVGARLTELAAESVLMTSAYQAALSEVEEFLTGERRTVETDRILTTVLFTDIVASTERAAELGDRQWRKLLDAHDRATRDLLRRFRGWEVKMTGDGFVASFDGPARAIRCAGAITGAARKLGIELRAGLHTGECEVRGDDLGGLAVHIAARVGASACPGEVLVSSTVKDLVVGSGIEFEDRGEHQLKGVPGSWRLFRVEG